MHNNMDHNVVISVASIVLNALWLEDAYEPVVLATSKPVMPTDDGPLDACIAACMDSPTHCSKLLTARSKRDCQRLPLLPSNKIHLLRRAADIDVCD